MKIGIIYTSKTGTTKGFAERAAELLRSMDHEVSITAVEEYDASSDEVFDLLLVGSYCDSNNYPKQMKKGFSSFRKPAAIASFVTHATAENGSYYEKWAAGCAQYYEKYCTENAVPSKGYFHCRAKPSKAIALFIKLVVFRGAKEDWLSYQKEIEDFPSDADRLRFDEFITGLSA
jgi:flavodoxin